MKIDKDLVAFITGASSGFGWQVASDLLKAGARVYLTDRSEEAVEFTEKYPSDRCMFREMDITEEDKVREAFEDCIKHFSYISVVVNCAGVASPQYSILEPECNATMLIDHLNINVVGTFTVTKYAALQLVKQWKDDNTKKQQKDYLIINFGNVASTHAMNKMCHYGASKVNTFIIIYHRNNLINHTLHNSILGSRPCDDTPSIERPRKVWYPSDHLYPRVLQHCYGETHPREVNNILNQSSAISL